MYSVYPVARSLRPIPSRALSTRKLLHRLCLIPLIGLLAACSQSSGGDPAREARQKFTTSEHALSVEIPDSLFAGGLRLQSSSGRQRETDPEKIRTHVLGLVDAYASHWVASRTAWQARVETIRGVTNTVVNDCTFPCPSSYNGLCAGSTDERSTTTVALYRLHRSKTKPLGWDQAGAYLNPRRSEDMRALAYAGGEYWTDEEPNDYYWCAMPANNHGLPAIQHEWDHILPHMDPHDRRDLRSILEIPLGLFTSALSLLGL